MHSVIAGCGANKATDGKTVTITGKTMGTTYKVKVSGWPKDRKVADVDAEINKRLATVNDQMSTWQKDSEISRFNKFRSTEYFPVSPATVTVMQEAARISILSDGAFDITVGPLVNLWSFGPENRPKKIPTDAEIAGGCNPPATATLRFQAKPPALWKTIPELSIDLSAIAKGHGVDVIAGYLESIGVGGYMVEIGGEVRCKGSKADGSPWTIGIHSPDGKKQPARVVRLKDRAMATSGDYRNYFEQNGKTLLPHHRPPHRQTGHAQTGLGQRDR